MGKKIKKFLKKAAKAAIIGGAIYGATKLAKNRKKKALNAITAGDIASPKNYQIPDTDMGVSPPTVNKRKEWRHGKRDGTSPFKINTTPDWAKGADTSRYKKGGRVTGCAKRGFGRALKRK